MIKTRLTNISINPCAKCALYLPKLKNGGITGYGCCATKKERELCSYDGNWIKIKIYTAYHKKTN
jgi:hypothetical protein